MKAYNLWWKTAGEWCDALVPKTGNHQDWFNPERLTLQEAQEFFDSLATPYLKERYILVQIGNNNEPIIPKCRLNEVCATKMRPHG